MIRFFLTSHLVAIGGQLFKGIHHILVCYALIKLFKHLKKMKILVASKRKHEKCVYLKKKKL
jgi:hypothetical protein